MFIKKCDFKCIKILAKCDTRTEKFKRKNVNIKGKTLKSHDNANLKGKTQI
jgi:hypothetical protein